MKSVRAAGAALAAGLLCNVGFAGFPNSVLNSGVPDGAGYSAYPVQQPYQQPYQPQYQGQSPVQYQPQQAAVGYGAVAPVSCATSDCGVPSYNPAPGYAAGPAYGAPQDIAVGEAGCDNGMVGGYGYQASPYYSAMNSPWTGPAVVGGGYGNAGCPTWFGSVYGLIMTRASDDPFYFGASDTDLSRLYLRSTEASNVYAGGIEARIGRTFNCCRWGLEVGYWGLYPNVENSQILAPAVPGTLMSKIDYSRVYVMAPDPVTGMPIGVPMTNYTDALQMIRISRDYEVTNVEINLLSGPLVSASGGCGSACGAGACGPCGPGACGPCGATGYAIGDSCYGAPIAPVARPRLNIGWGLGVRYFQFSDNLFIAMDNADYVIGYPGMPTVNEVFHQVEVDNSLVGLQLAMNGDYFLTKCFSLDFGTKFGLFGNHATHYQRIFNNNGAAYVLPTMPTDFTVRTTEDDVAFLGEIRAGVGYKVSKHVRLTGGYRAVAATGIASAVDQLEQERDMSALWHVRDIKRSDLLLHGAYAGLDFAW